MNSTHVPINEYVLPNTYEACQLGKSHKLHFIYVARNVNATLHVVHTNVWGLVLLILLMDIIGMFILLVILLGSRGFISLKLNHM